MAKRNNLFVSWRTMFRCVGWMMAVLFCAACSQTPARLEPPAIDASAAGQKAIQEYDKDGDGALSKEELAACPGLLASLQFYDEDSSGTISAEEVTKRVTSWQGSKVALTSYSCFVTAGGQPLEGATVKLIPEPFLGSNVKPASGVSDGEGFVVAEIAPADRNPEEKDHTGVHVGVYRIEITHAEKKIPAQFNSETTLGTEVVATIDQRPSIDRFDVIAN